MSNTIRPIQIDLLDIARELRKWPNPKPAERLREAVDYIDRLEEHVLQLEKALESRK